MPHDKIKKAARERMAETGENYTTARRAVIAAHEAAKMVRPTAPEVTSGDKPPYGNRGERGKVVSQS